MSESDLEYYRRRARQELRCASTARAPAQGLHRELAARYLRLIAAERSERRQRATWALWTTRIRVILDPFL